MPRSKVIDVTTFDNYLFRLMKNPEFTFIPAESIVLINVGGQLFETSCAILTKDPYSILAAICREKPLIPKNEADGYFYLDRDWWLFRHILSFLRSGALPNELETLKELYSEASFYRLESLQKAIENVPMSAIQNFTPQITTTWPGVMDAGVNPLRRPQDSYVLDGSLFRNL